MDSPLLKGLEAARIVARPEDQDLNQLLETGCILSERHRDGILRDLYRHLAGHTWEQSPLPIHHIYRLSRIVEIAGLNARLDLPSQGDEVRPPSVFSRQTAILISDLTGDTVEFEAAPIVLSGWDQLDKYVGRKIAEQLARAEIPEGKKVGKIRLELVVQKPT